MRSSHAIAFYPSSVIVVAFEELRILVNLTSGGLRPLEGIPDINLYVSVSTVTVPSWKHGFLSRHGFLSWCVEYMYLQNITVRLKFSVQDICPLWSHCSHCKHDLHDCREYPAPFSPEMMMIVIDHDTNIYIEW